MSTPAQAQYVPSFTNEVEISQMETDENKGKRSLLEDEVSRTIFKKRPTDPPTTETPPPKDKQVRINLDYPECDNGPFLIFVESIADEHLGTQHPSVIYNKFKDYISAEDTIAKSGNKIIFQIQDRKKANKFKDTINKIFPLTIQAYIPPSFVQICGVIRGVAQSVTMDEIVQCSTTENLKIIATSARRITRPLTDSEEKLPTLSVVVYFNSKELPKTVRLFGMSYKVSPYTPRISQCKRCWHFKHIDTHCRANQICVYCGNKMRDHKDQDMEKCTKIDSPKCINCGGNHKASNKSICPRYKLLLEDIKVNPFPGLTSRYGILEKPEKKLSFNSTTNTMSSSKTTSSSTRTLSKPVTSSLSFSSVTSNRFSPLTSRTEDDEDAIMDSDYSEDIIESSQPSTSTSNIFSSLFKGKKTRKRGRSQVPASDEDEEFLLNINPPKSDNNFSNKNPSITANSKPLNRINQSGSTIGEQHQERIHTRRNNTTATTQEDTEDNSSNFLQNILQNPMVKNLISMLKDVLKNILSFCMSEVFNSAPSFLSQFL